MSHREARTGWAFRLQIQRESLDHVTAVTSDTCRQKVDRKEMVIDSNDSNTIMRGTLMKNFVNVEVLWL